MKFVWLFIFSAQIYCISCQSGVQDFFPDTDDALDVINSARHSEGSGEEEETKTSSKKPDTEFLDKILNGSIESSKGIINRYEDEYEGNYEAKETTDSTDEPPTTSEEFSTTTSSRKNTRDIKYLDIKALKDMADSVYDFLNGTQQQSNGVKTNEQESKSANGSAGHERHNVQVQNVSTLLGLHPEKLQNFESLIAYSKTKQALSTSEAVSEAELNGTENSQSKSLNETATLNETAALKEDSTTAVSDYMKINGTNERNTKDFVDLKSNHQMIPKEEATNSNDSQKEEEKIEAPFGNPEKLNDSNLTQPKDALEQLDESSSVKEDPKTPSSTVIFPYVANMQIHSNAETKNSQEIAQTHSGEHQIQHERISGPQISEVHASIASIPSEEKAEGEVKENDDSSNRNNSGHPRIQHGYSVDLSPEVHGPVVEISSDPEQKVDVKNSEKNVHLGKAEERSTQHDADSIDSNEVTRIKLSIRSNQDEEHEVEESQENSNTTPNPNEHDTDLIDVSKDEYQSEESVQSERRFVESPKAYNSSRNAKEHDDDSVGISKEASQSEESISSEHEDDKESHEHLNSSELQQKEVKNSSSNAGVARSTPKSEILFVHKKNSTNVSETRTNNSRNAPENLNKTVFNVLSHKPIVPSAKNATKNACSCIFSSNYLVLISIFLPLVLYHLL